MNSSGTLFGWYQIRSLSVGNQLGGGGGAAARRDERSEGIGGGGGGGGMNPLLPIEEDGGGTGIGIDDPLPYQLENRGN